MNKRLEKALAVIAEKHCCCLCSIKSNCSFLRRNCVYLCDDVQMIAGVFLDKKVEYTCLGCNKCKKDENGFYCIYGDINDVKDICTDYEEEK